MKICPKCSAEHEKPGIFCSRKCSNSRTFSEESRKKKSLANKGRTSWRKGLKGKIGGKVRLPRITVECLHCQTEFTVRVNENRKYCSNDCWKKCSGGFRSNSTRKHRSLYQGFWMDSGAEEQFARLLDSHNIVWSKNTTVFFPYTDYEGKTRKYYPDFFLPEYGMWVEIKGKFYAKDTDTLKVQAVIESGARCELIGSDNIRLPEF
jgi:hypothetical protein